jgi:D-inositol-3-phosphate glycosyltransferase
VVAGLYGELIDELAAVRRRAPPSAGTRSDPVRGDPFRAFAGFPNGVLGPETPLSLPPGITPDHVLATGENELDRWAPGWRATLDECRRIMALVASGRAPTVAAVLAHFPADRRAFVSYGLVWMAKSGLIDWL